MLFISKTQGTHLIMKVPQKDQRFLQEVYSLSLNPKMPTSYEHDSTTLLVRSIGKKGNKKEEQRKSC